MGYALRSTLIVGSMYGLVFFFFFLIGQFMYQWPLYFIAAIAFGIIFLQYLISPLIIGWVFRIHWIDYNTLAAQYPHIEQLLGSVINKYHISPPRFGIIPDGTPNAFTFGWTKNSARLVISQGILNYLDEREQRAVVGHELGHIVHNDFVVMTFVSAIPTMFYMIFRIIIESYRYGGMSRRGNSKEASAWEAIRIVLAVLSYVFYIVGYLVSLLLSRIREYWADEFSAMETQDPNSLASSLVKIAYGIMQDPAKAQAGQNRSRYVSALGIFDGSSAKSVAYTATSANKTIDTGLLVKAAAWDLYQPWAKYFEILSTHPLPAKRIKELGYISFNKFNVAPAFDLSLCEAEFKKQMGRSGWDEFIGELTIHIMPKLIFFTWIIVTIALYATGFNFAAIPFLPNVGVFFAFSFVLAGIFQILQNSFKYRGEFKPNEIPDLLGVIKVSPIRPVPTITRGRIVGRGVPGLFWSEDMVIQDNTGIMYIDYDLGVGFLNALFGMIKVNRLVGQDVEITGWYRRGPNPYIQVHRILVLGTNNIYRNFKKGFWNVIAIILIALGLGLMFLLWGAL